MGNKYKNIMYYGVEYTFKEIIPELCKKQENTWDNYIDIWYKVNEFCNIVKIDYLPEDEECIYTVSIVLDENTTSQDLYLKTLHLENAIKKVTQSLNLEYKSPHFFTHTNVY